MWLRTIPRVRSNQKRESPVRTRPLSGIGVGSTTSNAEMRSDATSSSRSPNAYSSRTFPDAVWRRSSASGMGKLQVLERALEHVVDVAEEMVEIEDAIE